MIKIVQFGEGNFLRTFVDLYFDTLNKEGGDYKVNIVKPITFGTLDKFKAQNNKYHIVLRGVAGGKPVEDVYKVDVLENVIDPFSDTNLYYELAKDDQLKIIVSNTTEAGICFNANDKIDDFEGITYPAKLTKFLFERFNAGKEGVYLLPVELIDNNADELKKCVDKYIELWGLSNQFKKWNDEQNFYCNTLVDRIVSGYPKTPEDIAKVENLIGESDKLVSIGEPFGLWAVEKKGDIAKYVKEGVHNIEVVLTEDIKYYKKRKVRVLNGSHTNIVPVGLWSGAVTVYDCMVDEKLSKFVQDTLTEEIVPYVSDDIKATTVFADSITERFLNPYLNHLLTSISLNSISKWRARDLPSFKDYYNDHGAIPTRLTIGFSYLMAIYSNIVKIGDKYMVKLPSREIEILDDKPYLEYFANKNSIVDFMKDVSVWGEDLTNYNGFANTVIENVEKINKGISLI
ncbi:MAG: tagaturonate reductase [Clostridiales bacterium]|nr:tagaturonate reductase [Clostridiales bacterium]